MYSRIYNNALQLTINQTESDNHHTQISNLFSIFRQTVTDNLHITTTLSLKYQYQYPCLKYKYQYFSSKYQYQYEYLKMVLKYRSSTSTSTQYYNRAVLY